MASAIISFHPTTGVKACYNSSSDNRKPDTSHRKNQSSTNWWTPIFGWNSDPDYIDGKELSEKNSSKPTSVSSTSNSDINNSRSRFMPGCFTEEKAKQLRLKQWNL